MVKRLKEMENMLVTASKFKQETMENLFKLMDQEADYNCDISAEEEVLRRIGQSEVDDCLRVLQETDLREEERFHHLEEKALQVMARSYSYFSETIWTNFAVKELSYEAFKKLASAARKAKPDWDESRYGSIYSSCCSDEPNCACSESDYGQLSEESFQEDFKAILTWVEREDVGTERQNLVLAVFKNNQRKNKSSVLHWMKKKIKGWEIKEKEEEEEMKRIEEEVERDRALGIPFTCGIPGEYGEILDARFKELGDVVHGDEDDEKKNEQVMKLCRKYEAEQDYLEELSFESSLAILLQNELALIDHK
eukprot:GFUD01114063.1.p1 GENE.GFUD01114063.1~~GFUD01114063.1.p1  ORF type:complete len:360 (+),score=100.44 GFUD01114063.1:155-1081(+)